MKKLYVYIYQILSKYKIMATIYFINTPRNEIKISELINDNPINNNNKSELPSLDYGKLTITKSNNELDSVDKLTLINNLRQSAKIRSTGRVVDVHKIPLFLFHIQFRGMSVIRPMIGKYISTVHSFLTILGKFLKYVELDRKQCSIRVCRPITFIYDGVIYAKYILLFGKNAVQKDPLNLHIISRRVDVVIRFMNKYGICLEIDIRENVYINLFKIYALIRQFHENKIYNFF